MWLEALEYHQRGWSIFPMRMSTKRPKVRWKQFQREPASEAKIHEWFQKGDFGIGVVFGAVSGGLVSRDFDDLASYEAWAEKQPELAKTLPTVATKRGRHVYARATAEHIAAVRSLIGKPGGTGAITVAGGELRCGVGCYSVLPPSVHPSGHVYAWIVPLPEGPLPEVDVFSSGLYQSPDSSQVSLKGGKSRKGGEEFPHPSLLKGGREFPNPPLSARPADTRCNREHREHRDYRGEQRVQKKTDAIERTATENPTKPNTPKKVSDCSQWSIPIQTAIAESLPDGPGQRNRQVFDLARGLKAVPELADASAQSLKPYVRRWHDLCKDKINTKPFEESWIDFLKAWPRVRQPKGKDAMTEIFERSKTHELPEVAQEYEQAGLKQLIGFCRELQRSCGEGPFYLACRTAGRLFGVDHTTANRWLFLLVEEGVLEIVEPGQRAKQLATRYRYLGKV